MSNKQILLILESPGKIQKVQSILGKGYKAVSTVGHLLDLPSKTMSVDIKKNFEPTYDSIPRQRKVIQNLRKEAKKSKSILLLGDQDREGAFINWSVAQILKLKNPKQIVYNSITKDALLKAIKNPVDIDMRQVEAQKTRRILDRIVGYELSPLLWKNVQFGLSAGRVQSVVARLIVDKENEINEFLSKGTSSYFKFKGTFAMKKNPFITILHDLKSKDNGIFKGPPAKIDSKNEARNLLKSCSKSIFNVANVFDRKKQSQPSTPFTTSTLQQEAGRKLGFSSKRTMMAAQRLYEAGHITYMRTDSVILSKEALDAIKKYIVSTYGKKYYRQKTYTSKAKHIQEAHEAVRPTHVEKYTVNGNKIGSDEKKLYSLIWKRSIASQMMPAIFKITSIQISISKVPKYYFMTSIENLLFDGYLKVYNVKNLEEENGEGVDIIVNKYYIVVPDVGAKLTPKDITGTQTYNQPPKRYTEASLVSKLDPKNLNIARPATYASIIAKIQDRGYVRKADVPGEEKESLIMSWKGNKIEENIQKVIIGKENNKFMPTTIGILVTNYLIKGFPKIMDYKFTAEMEEQLDDIANGKLKRIDVLKRFYKDFHPLVEKLLKQAPLIEDKYTKILGKDPETNLDIIATIGKYGPMVKLCLTKTKCKIGPIKPPLTLETITLEDALRILIYPKDLGKYKRSKVILKTGKYGLYLTWNKKNYPVQKDVSLKEAIVEIEKKEEERKKKILAEFKSDKKIYQVLEGPYGKYIKVSLLKGKSKSKLPYISLKDIKIEDLTLEKVEELEQKNYERRKTRWKKKKGTKTAKKTVVSKRIIKKARKKNIIIE